MKILDLSIEIDIDILNPLTKQMHRRHAENKN